MGLAVTVFEWPYELVSETKLENGKYKIILVNPRGSEVPATLSSDELEILKKSKVLTGKDLDSYQK